MSAGARSCNKDIGMNFESIIGLAASALLLIYLTYALLRPEKF